jgi:hypothetical protein
VHPPAAKCTPSRQCAPSGDKVHGYRDVGEVTVDEKETCEKMRRMQGKEEQTKKDRSLAGGVPPPPEKILATPMHATSCFTNRDRFSLLEVSF